MRKSLIIAICLCCLAGHAYGYLDSLMVSNGVVRAPTGTVTFLYQIIVPAPTNGTDAATKTYVDNAAAAVQQFMTNGTGIFYAGGDVAMLTNVFIGNNLTVTNDVQIDGNLNIDGTFDFPGFTNGLFALDLFGGNYQGGNLAIGDTNFANTALRVKGGSTWSRLSYSAGGALLESLDTVSGNHILAGTSDAHSYTAVNGIEAGTFLRGLRVESLGAADIILNIRNPAFDVAVVNTNTDKVVWFTSAGNVNASGTVSAINGLIAESGGLIVTGNVVGSGSDIITNFASAFFGGLELSADLNVHGDAFFTGTVNVAGGVILSNTLQFVEMADPGFSAGLLFYDEDTKALSFYDDESESLLPIGQKHWVAARNTSGATIPQFMPVYQTGAVGRRATVAVARADDPTKADVIGITDHSLENNTDGVLLLAGVKTGVDTDGSPWGESWSAKDIIYLNSTSGLTNIKPIYPEVANPMGKVLTAANNGTFYALPRNHQAVTEYDNVIFSNITITASAHIGGALNMSGAGPITNAGYYQVFMLSTNIQLTLNNSPGGFMGWFPDETLTTEPIVRWGPNAIFHHKDVTMSSNLTVVGTIGSGNITITDASPFLDLVDSTGGAIDARIKQDSDQLLFQLDNDDDIFYTAFFINETNTTGGTLVIAETTTDGKAMTANGDVDVLGKLSVTYSGTGTDAPIVVANPSSATTTPIFIGLGANIVQGQSTIVRHGRASSSLNSSDSVFTYDGASSTNNFATWGLWGLQAIKVLGSGRTELPLANTEGVALHLATGSISGTNQNIIGELYSISNSQDITTSWVVWSNNTAITIGNISSTSTSLVIRVAGDYMATGSDSGLQDSGAGVEYEFHVATNGLVVPRIGWDRKLSAASSPGAAPMSGLLENLRVDDIVTQPIRADGTATLTLTQHSFILQRIN